MAPCGPLGKTHLSRSTEKEVNFEEDVGGGGAQGARDRAVEGGPILPVRLKKEEPVPLTGHWALEKKSKGEEWGESRSWRPKWKEPQKGEPATFFAEKKEPREGKT